MNTNQRRNAVQRTEPNTTTEQPTKREEKWMEGIKEIKQVIIINNRSVNQRREKRKIINRQIDKTKLRRR
jgi:hypothetical protein